MPRTARLPSFPSRTSRQAFRDLVGREPGQVHPFTVPIPRPAPLPAAALFHYWYPGRENAERCPSWFTQQLQSVSPDLACVRPPGRAPIRSRCWLVWYRCPRITHWLSPGWLLILAWHLPDGTPLPLDNRILANLYLQSAQVFGSAKGYFDAITADLQRTQEKQQQEQRQYRHDRAKDLFDTTRISSAGRGNRFALHHDGTVVPSRGEENWRWEIDRTALPPELRKR